MAFQYVGEELRLFQHASNWKAYLREQLAPFIRGDVLEVGAGVGATTIALHDERCSSWTCLEPDAGFVQELERELAALKDRSGKCPQVACMTLADLDPTLRYDSILYVDVLEHIRDDREELQRAAARLRPGGRVIVLAPAHQWLFSPFDAAIGHFRRYDAQSLASISPPLTQIACARYLDCVGIAASLANRRLMRASMPTTKQVLTWDRLIVPISRKLDPWLRYRFGKSVLVVWRRDQPFGATS